MKRITTLILLFVYQLSFGQIFFPDSSYAKPKPPANIGKRTLIGKNTFNGVQPSSFITTPIAPNAASLARNGDITANMNSGQLNVSIPLHEIKLKDFTLPISIQYGSNGLKMSEVAGWVGTGFSLSCMSVINRQVRSLPDEVTFGYNGEKPTGINVENYANNVSEIDFYPMSGYNNNALIEKGNFARGMIDNLYDSEPDMFYLSGPGIGSTFYFDNTENNVLAVGGFKTLNASQIPLSENKITGKFHIYGVNNYGNNNAKGIIKEFVIKDKQGHKYTFDYKDGSEILAEDGPEILRSNENIFNSWFLSKINTVHGNEINFTYKNRFIIHPPNFIQEDILPLDLENDPSATISVGDISYSQTRVLDIYLDKIEVNNGLGETIKFIENNEVRTDWNFSNNDLYAAEKPKSLGQIVVLKPNSDTLKTFNLEYLNAGRLLLRKVEEKSKNQSAKHVFEYFNEATVPLYYDINQSSFPEDYYGNYNGILSPNLVPTYETTIVDNWLSLNVTGTNKTPSLNFAKTGVLKSVTYPTGGKVTFDYELNSVIDSTVSENNSICQYANNLVINETLIANKSIVRIGSKVAYISKNIEIPESVDIERSCITIETDFGLGGVNASSDVYGTVMLTDENGVILFEKSFTSSQSINETQFSSFSKTFTLPFIVTNIRDRRKLQLHAKIEFEESSPSLLPSNFSKIKILVNEGTELINNRAKLINTGGLRLKEQIFMPNGLNLTGANFKSYNYSSNNSNTSGTSISPIKNTQNIVMTYLANSNNGNNSFYNSTFASKVSAGSFLPVVNQNGNPVYYDQIEEKVGGFDNLGNKIFLGSSLNNFIPYWEAPEIFTSITFGKLQTFAPNVNFSWKRGSPVEIKQKDKTGNLSSISKNKYDTKKYKLYSKKAIKIIPYWLIKYQNNGIFEPLKFNSNPYGQATGSHELTNSINQTNIDASNPLGNTTTIEVNYNHPTRLQMTSSTTTDSKNQTLKTEYKYPYDFTDPASTSMTNKNIISPILQETQTRGTEHIMTKSTEYETFGSYQLPKKITSKIGDDATGTVEAVFNSYDSRANPTSITDVAGNTQTITYYDTAGLLDQPHTISIGNSVLNNYEYEPLIGLKKMTDINGKILNYNYDGFNRLKSVTDQNNLIVANYCYNYAGQTVDCATLNQTGKITGPGLDLIDFVAGPLPIKLINFTAKKQANDALILWQATETNVQNYELQHSLNAKEWQKLTIVPAIAKKQYQFVHQNPAKGTHYYRLKSYDLDGKSEQSKIISLNFDGNGFVYPNPIKNGTKLNLDMANYNEIATLQLNEATGKLLANLKLDKSIDLGKYPIGSYLLGIKYKNGIKVTHKIVKQ